MTEHKHAAVLRAIADGVSVDEFEARGRSLKNWTRWSDGIGGLSYWISRPDEWEIRRKPQHIIVNGFKVTKPLDVLPETGRVWSPMPQATDYVGFDDVSSPWAIRSLERGIAHETKEAAIAHAKAMLGIDPKWEEE